MDHSLFSNVLLVLNQTEYKKGQKLPYTLQDSGMWELYKNGSIDVVLHAPLTQHKIIDLTKLSKKILQEIGKELELPAYWTYKKENLANQLLKELSV